MKKNYDQMRKQHEHVWNDRLLDGMIHSQGFCLTLEGFIASTIKI